MKNTYHFISGLPRSGSTLLSAILSQNPNFVSGITDLLQLYLSTLISASGSMVGVSTTLSDEEKQRVMKGFFDLYYTCEDKVVFNTSRNWTAMTHVLKELVPEFRMIVCVRDINEILNSFERLDRKNPYTIKPLYNHQELRTVFERCEMLMGNMNAPGYVLEPLKGLVQCINSDEVNQIMFIEYKALCQRPQEVMKVLYRFIDQPYFEHDFSDVEVRYEEYDKSTMIKDLHTTRKVIEYKETDFILPEEILAKYAGSSFWNHPNFDKSKYVWIS